MTMRNKVRGERRCTHADADARVCSVITVIGEKAKDVTIGNVTLSKARGEIALDRAQRVTSFKLHHLKELDTTVCESVYKNTGTGELGGLTWSRRG